MNRAQRRRAGITGPQAALIKQQATCEAVDTAFFLLLSIPVMVLHDRWGFGRRRLERFSDQVFDLYEDFDSGRVTLYDLRKTLEEETGVKIK